MLKNYQKAVEYHERHLAVATEVKDKTGQREFPCVRSWISTLPGTCVSIRRLCPARVCPHSVIVRAYYNLYKGYQVLRDTQRAQYYREMVDKNQVSSVPNIAPPPSLSAAPLNQL